MPTQLTLTQKARIIAAVPLTFVAILLVFSLWLLHQSEVDAHQSDLSKSIISKTTDAMEACHDVGIAFVVYDAATKPYFEQIYIDKVNAMHLRLADLALAVKNDPKHFTIVYKAAEEAEESLKILEKRKATFKAGGKLDLVEALDLEEVLKTIIKQLETIIADEKAEQEVRATQRTGALLKPLLGLTLLSIALALLVVFIFQRETDKRWKVVLDNSYRLGAGQPLAAVLEGKDEFAQIDRVFHDATNRLNEAARLKQQFVAMISHDLRTPLSAVKSTLELLGDETWGEQSDKAKTKIVRAEENLRHAINLINNLLDLEKIQSGSIELRTEHVNLGELLTRCANVVAPLAERSSIAITSPPSCAIELLADDQRLSQVIINLLGNAIKFSPPGSKITINAAQEQDRIKVSIQDQGPGIPEELSEKIFDRYQQVDSADGVKHEGHGLGLAICKAIVDAHGGTIGVESQLGKGSNFWIRIPQGGGL
ncbi:MAG: HAMP domain-containing sensor histidine kinase [Candidatus Melainabacteria bacterium]|nr:HAMP domain-containing sensor histidine kinase [Candidatus Melainabacteria bacterium]